MIDLDTYDHTTEDAGNVELMIETVEDQYNYHRWNDAQTRNGELVRRALSDAAVVILENVPPCEDRKAALRKLREARMDANSGITHRGKY